MLHPVATRGGRVAPPADPVINPCVAVQKCGATSNVAVITFRGTLIGTFGGARMQTAPYSYHGVWVREGSEWRVVFSEETR